MLNQNSILKIKKRRTFAIISHPDSGKTTITEKFLLLGKVIHEAGTIKSRKSKKYAKSDWMEIEKKRGISVTTSIIKFVYLKHHLNLLDTPGHEDFSEDTYRVLTAVDCCIMVIDASKSVEKRTIKLMKVARLRKIPIITFINKLDRDSHDFFKILDDIENKLKIICIPINWPIGSGRNFKGVISIDKKKVSLYIKNTLKENNKLTEFIFYLKNKTLNKYFKKNEIFNLKEELDLIKSYYTKFNKKNFLKGIETPIFFGSALSNFGIDHVLKSLVDWAPYPKYRYSLTRKIKSIEKTFSGFVFKIQANMNLKHHDRIAFIRIVSGKYKKGMKFYHVRTKTKSIINNAVNFIAGKRFLIDNAYPGDIIGIYSKGNIKIGDTYTEGENISFSEIPKFSPELFRLVYLKDSFKQKKLLRGLNQLSEEGVVYLFKPFLNNSLILGVIGRLQFDVVLERLNFEYKVLANYKKTNISCIRWISSNNKKFLEKFKKENFSSLAYDNNNEIVYFSTSIFKLNIIISKYKNIIFSKIKQI
ncbi:Peptide chain release factor RF3 [Buchnera aphidicola (Periphyllus testudinaceus)]|uniref:peptide chain release factor 3 n=1 Tax=Buchnera aphidicola TaxID=9 RepID=UPI003A668FEB